MPHTVENNVTPEDFQHRLDQVGGKNRYDESNFLIVWGQGGHPACTFRAGGVWSVDEQYFHGYRDLLKTSGEPCWSLLQWHDSVEYGLPESYYVSNLDETTGLQILGEFPYNGRYEILYNLRYREIVDNQLVFESMPLSGFLLEVVIPILTEAKDISIEKKKAAHADLREREERAKLSAVEQQMREAALPFRDNAISYTRQGCRTSIIDKKVLEMSRNWDTILQRAKKLHKGIQTSDKAQ